MSAPRNILVCFAVKEEARHFRRLIRGRPGLEVLLTGMGRSNARDALSLAVERHRPGLVVTAGFAGALVPELAPGTVVFEAAPATGLREALLQANARPARFHCSEKVVSTAREKALLRQQTGAEVVEMESVEIRDWCEARGIPVAIVRIILDTAAEDLPIDFNQVLSQDLRLSPVKLGLHLLGSPWKIPGLIRLGQQSAAASKVLGITLRGILP